MVMQCPICGGRGCDECVGGEIEHTSCPLYLIGGDIADAIDYAELWEKGLPPIAGGALDQSQSFIIAARFIFAEKNYWKSKLGLF